MAITAALGIVGSLGGLLGGGGGPRAPRMNNEQKQLMQSQANLNNAMAQKLRQGGQGINKCCKSLHGQRCQRCGGPLAHQGMNGAHHGHDHHGHGYHDNMGSMFGDNFGASFGFGAGFHPPHIMPEFSFGLNMRFG